MNIYRHGDVSLHPTKEVSGTKIEHNGEFILALGEHTGHAHRLKVADPSHLDIYKNAIGETILHLMEKAWITHEEHHKIEIEPGIYIQKQEREFDYFLNEATQVQD